MKVAAPKVAARARSRAAPRSSRPGPPPWSTSSRISFCRSAIASNELGTSRSTETEEEESLRMLRSNMLGEVCGAPPGAEHPCWR